MGNYAGFSKVKLRKPERSKFDLSHEKKLSCRMGKLVPIFISETLPNDTFRVNSEILVRLAPLLAPIYHRVSVFVHYFFVPMRLLEGSWEEVITNGRLGDSIEQGYDISYARIKNILEVGDNLLDKSSLADYLGVPNIPDADAALWGDKKRINLAPFAAYMQIWMDYYRDRNYVADDAYNISLPASGGLHLAGACSSLFYLRTRAWKHDYFTSALPFTQRGSEVLIPMEAAVTYLDQSLVKKSDGSASSGHILASFSGGLTDNVGNATFPQRIENIETIENSTITINDLRQAVRLQEWFERNAVAGSRYNESIMAHFARRTSDSRLQRAEYLGGGRVQVQISEVMTTAFSKDSEDTVVPPATMTGRGATYAKQNGFKYNCEEHGFVVGIMSIMPEPAYMNGMPRMFQSRSTFLDYPWPSFAHLGEQEVYQYEIFMDPATLPDNVPASGDVTDPPVFGYQSRYADWKYINSTAHGDFRSTLDYWHLDRKFAVLPSLNEAFVTFEDALQDRIFAVSGVDTIWCYIHNSVSVVRSLPYFGTPQL